jgi:hypothetical protein
MGTWGPFLGAKARPGRDADHSPLFIAEVKNDLRAISSLPKRVFVACSGTANSANKVLNFHFVLRMKRTLIEHETARNFPVYSDTSSHMTTQSM